MEFCSGLLCVQDGGTSDILVSVLFSTFYTLLPCVLVCGNCGRSTVVLATLTFRHLVIWNRPTVSSPHGNTVVLPSGLNLTRGNDCFAAAVVLGVYPAPTTSRSTDVVTCSDIVPQSVQTVHSRDIRLVTLTVHCVVRPAGTQTGAISRASGMDLLLALPVLLGNTTLVG